MQLWLAKLHACTENEACFIIIWNGPFNAAFQHRLTTWEVKSARLHYRFCSEAVAKWGLGLSGWLSQKTWEMHHEKPSSAWFSNTPPTIRSRVNQNRPKVCLQGLWTLTNHFPNRPSWSEFWGHNESWNQDSAWWFGIWQTVFHMVLVIA